MLSVGHRKQEEHFSNLANSLRPTLKRTSKMYGHKSSIAYFCVLLWIALPTAFPLAYHASQIRNLRNLG
uniref:G_PROTEIN_RECEP_F1_2 domain-containing protein n=1 Tax=Steinernema glaseri TaxID=37863 RepID=A0A1I8A3B2_9BILA